MPCRHLATATQLTQLRSALIGKHGFTKDQLPKLEKVSSTTLVKADLLQKVKAALKGKTVTATQLDTFLFTNGIKPYSRTGAARKELKTTGVIEVKENAAGTSTYIWLAGEKMLVPAGGEMGEADSQ